MKFQVLTPIRHDGEDYAEGDEIEMTAKEAKQLVDVGAVQAVATTKTAKQDA